MIDKAVAELSVAQDQARPAHERELPGDDVVGQRAGSEENTYIICLHGKELAGMMAMRGERPFSLDKKVENLDSYLPDGRRLVEIRLLAVEKNFRNGHVFHGMLALLISHGKAQGYNVALISGTTRQAKLYRHLGFVP